MLYNKLHAGEKEYHEKYSDKLFKIIYLMEH